MGVYIFYTINDGKNEKSTVRFNITDFGVGGIEDLGQLILDFAPVVKALVDGGLENAGYGVDLDIPALTWSNIAAAAADVQEKVFFGFRTVDHNPSHFTLPTVKESIFSVGTKLVDTANVAVAALVTAMEDGFTSGGALFRFGDTHEGDYTVLKQAREAWGKYRK